MFSLICALVISSIETGIDTSLAALDEGRNWCDSHRPSLQSERRRAHHQHGDHAAEESEQGDAGDAKNDSPSRVALAIPVREWRGVCKIDRDCARLGRFRFNFFGLGQGL